MRCIKMNDDDDDKTRSNIARITSNHLYNQSNNINKLIHTINNRLTMKPIDHIDSRDDQYKRQQITAFGSLCRV